MKYFFSLLFVLCSLCSSGQPSKLDSLKSQLDTATGINRANVLSGLCWEFHFFNPDSAIIFGNTGLELAKTLNYKKGQAQILNNMGVIFTDKGEYEKALEYYIKSEKIYEKLDNKNGMAQTTCNMAALYLRQKLYDKALEYYTSAYTISKLSENKVAEARALNGKGNLFYEINEKEKALNCFSQALETNKEINNIRGISEGLNNVAVIYEELGNYTQALVYHKQSLQLSRNQKDIISIAISLTNIGLVYKSLKDYDLAVTYLDSGIYIAREIGDYINLIEYYKTLSEIYVLSGDYKKALECKDFASAASDSVLSQERTKQIIEMGTKYESAKKELENKRLTAETDKQKAINVGTTIGLVLFAGLAFFIFRSYQQKQRANKLLGQKNILIEQQKKQVEEKNKDITDSIRYAKRLQSAILKPEKDLEKCFEDGFVLFKPKDIVSGDFYWFEKFGNLSLISAADCTGHGVPGAFMSIIGCNLLSQAVNEHAITKPGAILNSVNKGLLKALQQKHEEATIKDGMDIALCSFDSEKMMVEFAGAYNPMWILRNGKLIEIKGDKFPVGAFVGEQQRIFTNTEIPVEKNDIIYFFSDGYADQFGGPSGKKFKYARMREMFLNNFKKPMKEQREIFNTIIEDWKGKLEQIDDILLMGIKI